MSTSHSGKVCYLCNHRRLTERSGVVRDAPAMRILECAGCGLVQIEDDTHISEGFYEGSGMHGEYPVTVDHWLREAEWDDKRRFEQLKALIVNSLILDFGSGAGGFLKRAQKLATRAIGVELESRVKNHWGNDLEIVSSIDEAYQLSEGKHDLITAFHVLEHLKDPRETLKELGKLLSNDGHMIVEVPNADDALLTLFDCKSFQSFTYWSQHLFLFTSATLATLIEQAGLKVVSVQHYQRYPISNHLYWLSKGAPSGHQKWSFLDSDALNYSYANALAGLGKTDTLIATVKK